MISKIKKSMNEQIHSLRESSIIKKIYSFLVIAFIISSFILLFVVFLILQQYQEIRNKSWDHITIPELCVDIKNVLLGSNNICILLVIILLFFSLFFFFMKESEPFKNIDCKDKVILLISSLFIVLQLRILESSNPSAKWQIFVLYTIIINVVIFLYYLSQIDKSPDNLNTWVIILIIMQVTCAMKISDKENLRYELTFWAGMVYVALPAVVIYELDKLKRFKNRVSKRLLEKYKTQNKIKQSNNY